MEKLTYFDRYRIATGADGVPSEAARCGAAVVYRAIDLQTGEPVALKVLRLDPSETTTREEIETRARAAQHVEHENVARVLSFTADLEELVIVSELPAGESIASWIATHGPIAPDAVTRAGVQVVNALSAAAFHGLTHGAIEPGNLFITSGTAPDGRWPFIKLLNLDVAGTRPPMNSGAIAGLAAPAPQFAAPEQVQSGIVDFRSEIYSLGATMAFMLTGLAPSRGSIGGEPQRLPAALRRAPRVLRNIITQMLELDPERRPQDPVLFAEQLRACLATIERRPSVGRQSIPAAAPMPIHVPRSEFAWKPWAIAAGIVGAVMIAGLLIAVPLRSAHRSRPADAVGVAVGVPDNVAAATARSVSTPAQTADVAAAPSQNAEAAASQPADANGNANADAVASNSATANAPQTPAEAARETSNAVAQDQTSQTAQPVQQQETTAVQQPQDAEEPQSRPVVADNNNSNSAPEKSAIAADPHPAAEAPRTSSSKPVKVASNNSAARPHATPSAHPVRHESRAKFVGTTSDGDWIFDAPTGGQATIQLPNSDDAAATAQQRTRRRQRVERAQPVDREPQVLRAQPVDE